MKKRALSLILALVLVCSILPITASAATYTDVEGTWAEDAIMRFSTYEILQGFTDGSFKPSGDLTRGQMAVIIAKLLNLPEAEDAGFADVDPDAYYAAAINSCYAAGIMLGSNGNANPTDSISRQDTIVMLARALGITPSENADLSNYSDAESVSDYAKGYVAAMSEAGIVKGTTTDTVGAKNDIDRASFVTILDRAIEEIVDKPGTTYTAQGTGIVLVKADDATVTGTVQDVLVAQGTGTGSVTVKDATVTGSVTVQSDATVTVTGTTEVKNVVVAEKAAAKVTVDTDVKAEKVEVKGAQSDVTISGTTTDVTVADTATDATVTVKDATVTGTVAVNSDAKVNVTGSTTVNSVTVAENAKAAVTVEKDAAVNTVDVKGADSTINVSGTVKEVNIDADNATVSGSGNVEQVNVTESKQETAKVETPNTTITVVEDNTISGSVGGDTGSTTTTTPTVATTTIPQSKINEFIDEFETKINSDNEIKVNEYITLKRSGSTITIGVIAPTVTVADVYQRVGQTLTNALSYEEYTKYVASITTNGAKLELSDSLELKVVNDFIKAAGISATDSLASLIGKNFTISVATTTYGVTTSATYRYTVTFADETPQG
jgi:hypothetical protein